MFFENNEFENKFLFMEQLFTGETPNLLVVLDVKMFVFVKIITLVFELINLMKGTINN